MNKNIFLGTAVALILVSAFFFGCKENSQAGIGIVPKDVLIQFESSDTIDIEAYTNRVNSIVTSNTSSVLLGSYDDPIFGKVQAGFVIQIQPGSSSGFGTGAVADSIVLSLRYASDSLVPIYGTQGQTMDFIAQEITTKLYKDTIYYSNQSPESLNLTDELVNTTFVPKDGRKDTVILDIHLNKDFGQKIVDNYDFWHDDEEPADTSFYDFFSGMYIKSNDIPFNGSISTFSIIDQYSKVVLYYHNSVEDSLSLNFSISQFSTRFNMFSHEHDAPDFLPDLDNPEAKQDTVVYLQGIGGLKVHIKIPELDEIKKSGLWGVNKAELVLPVHHTNETGLYPVPLEVKIFGVSDEEERLFLDDYYNYSNNSYLGVDYTDNKYRFDITYRVQQILSGSIENNGFYIFPSSDYINPSRVVLTGPGHSNRMKLILTLQNLD